MKYLSILLFYGLISFTSCSTSSSISHDKKAIEALPPLTFSATAATDWTALFERTSGWFGADGIFTIPLDGIEDQQVKDKKTLFIFSDTYIGEVVKNIPQPGHVMVNNTSAWMDGVEPIESKIDFAYHQDKNNNPQSYFVPNDDLAKPNEYYWLGDGFINHEKNNALYIFAYHVHKTGPNVFDFEQTNISLLKVNNPTRNQLDEHTQIPTPLGFVHPDHGRVYFGSGLFVNTQAAHALDPDGYLYVYGIMENEKSLIAARVKPRDFEKFEAWRFWDGTSWNKDKRAVASITNGISNEISITPTGDGRYLLTYQILGISDKIGVQVGNSPIGPFGKIHEVYTCPEYAEGLFPYNAKAHYHLSKPGELLISYNTITLDFWEDIKKDATIYHPRFIRLRY